MSQIYEYISRNENDTLGLGQEIGKLLKSGHIILLSGDLGAGKTLLVKGIGKSLGLAETEIISPTYTLINEYQGRLPLFHLDLYRLETETELYEIGFEDYLERNGVIVIEWPQLALNLIPPDFLEIKIKVKDQKQRHIEIKAKGEKSNKLKEKLQERIADNADTGD